MFEVKFEYPEHWSIISKNCPRSLWFKDQDSAETVADVLRVNGYTVLVARGARQYEPKQSLV